MTAFDLAVVGGGPAGMSCAATAQALGVRTVVVERFALGGELATLGTVTGLPWAPTASGPDVAADLVDAVLDSGAAVEYREVGSLAVDAAGWVIDDDLQARVLVLATGARVDLRDVPGAAERHGQGVSVCGTCDGPLFAGKDVAVIGSGQFAVVTATEVSAYAASVTLVPPAPLSASAGALACASALPNVTVLEPAPVEGLAGSPVTAVHLSAGRELPVQGAFVATARRARTDLVVPFVELVEDRCPVDAGLQAALSVRAPLYAVGDVRAGTSSTVAGALGDGATAAWGVARHLHGVTP